MALSEERRQQLDNNIKADEAQARFEAELNSDDPAIRKKAAEQRLANRLQKLHGLDPEFIICAEYQLFLDEKRKEYEYFQPPHWTDISFPKEQAGLPILGIERWGAASFVAWLNEFPHADGHYRLPLSAEIQPGSLGGPYGACWCEDKNYIFTIQGLAVQAEKELLRKIARLAKSDLPPPSSLIRDRALVLAHDLALTLNLNLDPASAFDRTLGRARGRALALDRTFDRAIVRVSDLAFGETGPKIVAALEHKEVDEALHLARPLTNSNNIYEVRRTNLLVDLLEAAKASRVLEQGRAYRHYAAHFAQYAYIGYSELEKSERKKNYSEEKQLMADLFWWMQVVTAREEQGFPAWEGIRIVAE